MGNGNGFTLTNEEAHLVHKLVSDAFTRATDDTVADVIGNEDAISVAGKLYMKLTEAMRGGRFP